jgi:hypothetical protein
VKRHRERDAEEQGGTSTAKDAESAKMARARGVVQGYNGLAVVDERAHIVVHAEARGQGTRRTSWHHCSMRAVTVTAPKGTWALGDRETGFPVQ